MPLRQLSLLPLVLCAFALAPRVLDAADAANAADAPHVATGRDSVAPLAAVYGAVGMDGAPATVPDGVTRFAADLWAKLPRVGNLAISPCSIHACLAMASVGARGETLVEMQRAVSLPAPHAVAQGWKDLAQALAPPRDAAPAWRWTMANALFAQDVIALSAPFTHTCADAYGAVAKVVDFSGDTAGAIGAINRWCSTATHGLLPSIVDASSVDAATRLVLADAVYFKATWADAFERSRSAPAPFYVSGDRTDAATFMHAVRACAAAELDGAQVVALPYAGGELEAVLVVPTARDGLSALEARLDRAELARLCQAPQALAEVRLALPRLHLAGDEIRLNGPLQALGMRDAFDAHRADFAGIGSASFFCSAVLHRCVIDLDEQGTTAAAATAVVMEAGAPPPQLSPMTITADHPFLLVIRHRASGAILFLARVADPAQS